MPGDEEIGHDDVELRRGRGEITASVVDDEPHVLTIEKLRVQRSEVDPSHLGDLRHDLDDREVRDVHGDTGTASNPRRHTDEGHVARGGMQEERNEALT